MTYESIYRHSNSTIRTKITLTSLLPSYAEILIWLLLVLPNEWAFIYLIVKELGNQNGGDDRTRTYYLHSANVTLSQLSYTPNYLLIALEWKEFNPFLFSCQTFFLFFSCFLLLFFPKFYERPLFRDINEKSIILIFCTSNMLFL